MDAGSYDFYSDRRDWRLMGALLWFGSFDFFGVFGMLPVAITWTNMNRGIKLSDSPRFFWYIYWYSVIAGNIFRVMNMFAALSMMNMYFEFWHYLDFFNLGRDAFRAICGVYLAIEITGFALYFNFRPGAWRYALYLNWAYNWDEPEIGRLGNGYNWGLWDWVFDEACQGTSAC